MCLLFLSDYCCVLMSHLHINGIRPQQIMLPQHIKWYQSHGSYFGYISLIMYMTLFLYNYYSWIRWSWRFVLKVYNIVYKYDIVHEYGRANNLHLEKLVACVVVWICACLGKFCHEGNRSLRSIGFKWDWCDPSSLSWKLFWCIFHMYWSLLVNF